MIDFLWTDKSSSKWYIIYSQGHEGPYSLDYLAGKVKEDKANAQLKVWAEGLTSDMTLEAVLTLAQPAVKKNEDLLDEPPPLPPLPIEETVEPEPAPKKEKAPQVEVAVAVEENVPLAIKKSKKWGITVAAFIVGLTAVGGVFSYLQNKKKEVSIHRPQGMSLKTADRLNDYLKFKSWNESLFLKEFISEDYQSIWLASSSFHRCEISANFKSQKDKLLSFNHEEVEFEGVGRLKNHLTEFNKFNFFNGSKIIPGMYDMTINARDCQWDGFIPQVMNLFKSPEESYSTKMSVILYANGADEFKDLLDRVLRKKLEKAVKEQNQVELFWQGVQEKLQTLLAISLQVEQQLLDFIKKDSRNFHQNLPIMVSEYTKKFGHFLTNFVIANEESFKESNLSEIRGVTNLKNYENLISESAKKLGFTSMKLIEDLQKSKNPRRVQLNEFETRVKIEFAQIKESINQKIIQVSDDRSLPQGEDLEEQSPSGN